MVARVRACIPISFEYTRAQKNQKAIKSKCAIFYTSGLIRIRCSLTAKRLIAQKYHKILCKHLAIKWSTVRSLDLAVIISLK